MTIISVSNCCTEDSCSEDDGHDINTQKIHNVHMLRQFSASYVSVILKQEGVPTF